MTPRTFWLASYWMLLAALLGAAVLGVLRVHGGFLTNHLADVVVPAWLYLVARGLGPGTRQGNRLIRAVGRTPERSAVLLFAASALTELSQRYWPHGLFPGRFDPYDVLAYAAALGASYVAERLVARPTGDDPQDSRATWSIGRVMFRLLADVILVAIMLFVAAGTVAWWRAWVLLGVLLLVRTVGALVVYRVNPGLLHERAGLPVRRDQLRADRALLLGVLATGFLALPLIAGLDAVRWHVLPRPAPLVADLGLVLFALGWGVKSLALRANTFAVTVVRLQTERAHAVADSGPYAVVRHPFYAADPLILIGLGWWLQSYVAALCAVLPISLMVVRLRLEERFLQRELPGYEAYTERVRFRLIPGIW